MALEDAPNFYLVANVGAACVAGSAFWLLRPINRQASLLAVAVIVPGLLACTFAGPAVAGVHRWIAVGPLKLHIAFLVLPFFATQLLQHDKRVVAVVASIAALLIALQPDRASAFVLFLMALGWLGIAKHQWALMPFFAAGAALVWTFLGADNLPPVRFVENVMGDATAGHPGIAAFLAGAMLLAIAAPVYLSWRSGSQQISGFVLWSVCLTGYFLASLVGAYPVPLLGFGVSPILGFGLALALLASDKDEAA